VSLKIHKPTVTLLQCSFCGSIHGSRQEARKHGCATRQEPNRCFEIGHEVMAEVTVAAGMSAVGKATIRCRITGFKKPVDMHEGLPVIPEELTAERHCRNFDTQGTMELSLNTRRPHEWMYALEALEEHPNDDKSYYCGHLYEESKLTPVS